MPARGVEPKTAVGIQTSTAKLLRRKLKQEKTEIKNKTSVINGFTKRVILVLL
jgi:hypothetical protein